KLEGRMRFLLATGVVALASCGPATAKKSAIHSRPESAEVRLQIIDATSGNPLAGKASGADVRCLPDGADLLCTVPGRSRYPVDVSASEYVTVPAWIGVAVLTSGNSFASPIATRV